MAGSSQTQNVQRGIIMVFFLNFLLLLIYVIMRFCKKQIDVDEDGTDGASKNQKKYQDKDNEVSKNKQSLEKIDNQFDKVAVKRSQLKEDATGLEKFLHRVQQFVYNYGPFLILLPLNILTGTSKAFSLTLFFLILICVILFNFAKLHKKIGDGKCINVVFENLWLLLCFFYCINQWGATPINMPYIVK